MELYVPVSDLLVEHIKNEPSMLNLLTIDGTILDKWRTSASDITLKGPMFSINQTLFIKGSFCYYIPPLEIHPIRGKTKALYSYASF